MKKIKLNLTILIIALTATIGGCQNIPKGANLVRIDSALLADIELFKLCIEVLKSEGYSFEQLDKDFYICSTKPIKANGAFLIYRIDLSVSSNKVEVRSYVSQGLTEVNQGLFLWERGANRSTNRSIWKYGWDKQVELVRSINVIAQGKIHYTIE